MSSRPSSASRVEQITGAPEERGLLTGVYAGEVWERNRRRHAPETQQEWERSLPVEGSNPDDHWRVWPGVVGGRGPSTPRGISRNAPRRSAVRRGSAPPEGVGPGLRLSGACVVRLGGAGGGTPRVGAQRL